MQPFETGTYQYVFKVYSSPQWLNSIFPLLLHFMVTPQYVYSFTYWRISEIFPVSGDYNTAIINIHMQILNRLKFSNQLRKNQLHGETVCGFVRNRPTIIQSGFTIAFIAATKESFYCSIFLPAFGIAGFLYEPL